MEVAHPAAQAAVHTSYNLIQGNGRQVPLRQGRQLRLDRAGSIAGRFVRRPVFIIVTDAYFCAASAIAACRVAVIKKSCSGFSGEGTKPYFW